MATRRFFLTAALARLSFGAARDETWRLAFGSCLHPKKMPWVSLKAITEENPDVVFLLGDTVYVDYDSSADRWWGREDLKAAPEHTINASFRRVWEETMKEPNLRHLLASPVPVYAAWDDHEFVNNFDAGMDSVVYSFGRQMFDEYLLPHLANRREWSGGFFSQSFDRAEFFMFDSRSHRDKLPMRKLEPEIVDTAGRSMLGAQQKETFLKWLEAVPHSKWLIIGSSGMLNHYPANESVSGNPECEQVDCASDVWYRFLDERNDLLERISKKTRNAIFLSGDSHYAGLFQLPGGLFELSASPLGAFGFSPPDAAFESMRQGQDVLFVAGGLDISSLYGEIAIDGASNLRIRLVQVAGSGQRRTLHEQVLPWQ